MAGEIGFNGAVSSSGSVFDTCHGFKLAADLYTAIAGDEVVAMHWWGAKVGGPARTVSLGIYVVTAGLPDTLVGSAVDVTVNNATLQLWSTGVLAIALTAGVTYSIAFTVNHAVNWSSQFKITASAMSRDNSTSLPATWSDDANVSREYQCYADVVNTPPPPPPASGGSAFAVNPSVSDLSDFGL